MSISALKIDEIKSKLSQVKNETIMSKNEPITSITIKNEAITSKTSKNEHINTENIENTANNTENTENTANNTENTENTANNTENTENTENISCINYRKKYVVCPECNRTILKRNLSQHQTRQICINANISNKPIILKNKIINKLDKYVLLYMKYKSEKNIDNKIKLFDNLKSLYNYINMKIQYSSELELELVEDIKGKIIDDLFERDYDLSKEHYKFLKLL